jgi:hypothetical protein
MLSTPESEAHPWSSAFADFNATFKVIKLLKNIYIFVSLSIFGGIISYWEWDKRIRPLITGNLLLKLSKQPIFKEMVTCFKMVIT